MDNVKDDLNSRKSESKKKWNKEMPSEEILFMGYILTELSASNM